MQLSIDRVAPDSAEAQALIHELDALLEPSYPAASRHGLSVQQLLQEQVDFYLVRADGQPAGCGGILWCADYAELKRMYARPHYRGLGLGQRLIEHFAALAQRRGVGQLRLETGLYQKAAIRLYESAGFQRIEPFGPYRQDPLSLCYAKEL